MPVASRIDVDRECYRAYETGDRALIERHLADDFVFSAPRDVGIDRATYFERCWPNAGTITAYEFPRLVEVGDEVLVRYIATRVDGTRFRNTEIHGFDGNRSAVSRSTSAGISRHLTGEGACPSVSPMTAIRLHDYAASANCFEVWLLLAQLGLDYERIPVDIVAADTLDDDYAARNPARETPVLEVRGRFLPESGAILAYLAEDTELLPEEP